MRRYPIEPLAETMGASMHQACLHLGVSGSTQKDYRARGVTEAVADRLAVRAGFHPAEVWPDFGMIECDECGEMVPPTTYDRRFCSHRCAARHSARKRYREDPTRRAVIRARRRRYYAETGS